MTHLLAHARRHGLGYSVVALAIVLGIGSGYAIAASQTKTITVCADKKTGLLHLDQRGRRCNRGQNRLSWNQQGPQGLQGVQGPHGAQGPQGVQGAQGAQGSAAVSVWANVGDSGTILAGRGVSVQRLSAGTYHVTITDPTCARETNAPVVSVSDSNPPAGPPAGEFPLAWYGATGANQQFMVFTGIFAGGSFTTTDHTFDIQDACP